MDLRISPSPLSGTVNAPPSKSAGHRALIGAALAGGQSRLRSIGASEDIEATRRALTALGARIDGDAQEMQVEGIPPVGARLADNAQEASPAPEVLIDCGESGSTERFLLPIVCALGRRAVFSGRGQLPGRPIGPLARVMEEHGAQFSRTDSLPLTLSGHLRPGEYVLPGNVSSQYITGLLFALPLLCGESEIRLSSPLESAGYVEMTLEALFACGIRVSRLNDGFHIPGSQRYQPGERRIEGDYSGAAFWLTAGALGKEIRCHGLAPNSVQGDREIVRLLSKFGGSCRWEGDCLLSSPTPDVPEGRPRPQTPGSITIDASSIPDLVPILCVAAAGTKGITKIQNAARLRIKECDRLAAMAECLTRLGGQVEEHPDGLTIAGTGQLRGGEVDGYGDHRIVMSMAVASILCREPVIIRGAEAVAKSYPGFFEDFKKLGGKYDVL